MKSLISCFLFLALAGGGNIDRDQFYTVFKSDSKDNISELIEHYENTDLSGSLLNVYKGALLIKKSSYLNSVSERIEYFSHGKELIEKEIADFPENIEYRFIRLILQEQTPPILRYKSEIPEDKNTIMNSLNSIDEALKKRIINYSSNSNILDYNELKNNL